LNPEPPGGAAFLFLGAKRAYLVEADSRMFEDLYDVVSLA